MAIICLLSTTLVAQHFYFKWRLHTKDLELARQRELVKFNESRLQESAQVWRLIAQEENADAN